MASSSVIGLNALIGVVSGILLFEARRDGVELGARLLKVRDILQPRHTANEVTAAVWLGRSRSETA